MPDDLFSRPLPPDIWNKYWAHGFLTSCAGAFSENYEGEMRRVWEGLFQDLPDGSAILDLGTGNGAVPMIAAEVAEKRGIGFEIHGVDLAMIRPDQAIKENRHLLSAIQFHSQIGMEHTGFQANSFDAVTAQYALEYGNMAAAVTEIGRITKPHAQVLFVCHHQDSIVLNTAREELRLSKALFDEIGLFTHAERLLEVLGDTPADQMSHLNQDPLACQRRDAVNRAGAQIQALLKTTEEKELLETAMGYVGQSFEKRGQWGWEKSLEHLNRGRSELSANVDRLRDLLRASVNPDELEILKKNLAKVGFLSKPAETLHHQAGQNQHLVGWVVRGQKGA